MNIDNYLKEIDCLNYREESLENLKKLQSNHLKRFPFENLDMHMNKKIIFSLQDSYDRLINQSRGGYCLQLNPIFGWLLKQLGYSVEFLPCYIFNIGFQKWNRLPIHCIILIRLDNKLYYVDVGTSRMVNEPVELSPDIIQLQSYGAYRFSKLEDDFYVLDRAKVKDYHENKNNAIWIHQIKFKLEPKELEYFQEMNEYVQTPEHPTMFYRSFASIHSDNSILSLNGWNYLQMSFDENNNEIRTEKVLNIEEVKDFLKNKFRLIIDDSFNPKFEDFTM
jgi:N-hydroxyarylamine O-acetyltransferase